MKRSVLEKIKVESDSAVPDHLQLARQLEQLIRTGELKEGEKLPPTLKLIDMWGVNNMRVQRTMEILSAEGLLQRFPKRGTFVTPKTVRPSVGILAGGDLLMEELHFTRFVTTALKNEIRDRGFNPRIYAGMENRKSEEGRRSLEDLHYDLRHHVFNGFITVSGFDLEMRLPGNFASQLPVVHVGVVAPGGATVSIDTNHFGVSATEWLLARGCRKPAFLYTTAGNNEHVRGFRETVKQAGLKLSKQAVMNLLPYGNGSGDEKLPATSKDRLACKRMESILPKWRKANFFPDGIVIGDDICARGVAVAIQALVGKRGKVPKMVVLTTKGVNHFYALPVARYETCADEKARQAMNLLMAKKTGELTDRNEKIILVRGEITDSYC